MYYHTRGQRISSSDFEFTTVSVSQLTLLTFKAIISLSQRRTYKKNMNSAPDMPEVNLTAHPLNPIGGYKAFCLLHNYCTIGEKGHEKRVSFLS